MILSEADLALRHRAAVSIAQSLGRIALAYQAAPERMATSAKGAQDFLTAADGDVEGRFRTAIAELFPGDAVLGEEQGGGDGDALWIIDPIDGTANFARGSRHWCVSIGFLWRGEPQIGVIQAPGFDECFAARLGCGATLNDAPIQAARTDSLTAASVELGWSTRLPNAVYVSRVEALMAAGASVLRSGSGALGLAHVAAGRSDGYAEGHINAWDVAAGVVIAREAGAWTSDFFTGDWRANGNAILACAPALAADLQAITATR